MEGGCFCGAVRYRLSDRPMFVNCRHCRDCQKLTGSAFAINAVIERERVVLTAGAPQPHPERTDSGRPHLIWRCDGCGSALWSDYGDRKTMIFLRVATLDDPGAFPPQAHIFTRSKLPWVALPAAARAFDVFYDLETEWPAASLARRRALGF
jgi:hypothetical protein